MGNISNPSPEISVREVDVFSKKYLFPFDTGFHGFTYLTGFDRELRQDPCKPNFCVTLQFFHANFPMQCIEIKNCIKKLGRQPLPKRWENLYTKAHFSPSFYHPSRPDVAKIDRIQSWFTHRFEEFIPQIQAELVKMFFEGRFETGALEALVPSTFS